MHEYCFPFMKMKITIKLIAPILYILLCGNYLHSQSSKSILTNTGNRSINTSKLIEFRSYNLKPGTRSEFNRLFIEQALPLLHKWKVEVVAYGASLHDSDSYFLVRAYDDLSQMQQSENAFYSSDDWQKGPRESILALIENYTTVVLPPDATNTLSNKMTDIETATNEESDRVRLSDLNAKFIENFINEDASSHAQIIHKNFICIESDGSIVDRETYLKNWTSDYARSGYKSFSYGDENIRVFGNTALVRSATTYTKMVDGRIITGHSVYTDTYVKESGQWWCVQAHITSVKK